VELASLTRSPKLLRSSPFFQKKIPHFHFAEVLPFLRPFSSHCMCSFFTSDFLLYHFYSFPRSFYLLFLVPPAMGCITGIFHCTPFSLLRSENLLLCYNLCGANFCLDIGSKLPFTRNRKFLLSGLIPFCAGLYLSFSFFFARPAGRSAMPARGIFLVSFFTVFCSFFPWEVTCVCC